MRKEHIRNAIIIGLSTSFVIAGAYLLMPDKYKDTINKKAVDLKNKVVGLKDKFKKKHPEEVPAAATIEKGSEKEVVESNGTSGQ